MPIWPLRRNELWTIRRSCEKNTPSTSPSGLGLSLAVLPRCTVADELPMRKPNHWLCEDASFTRRLSRTLRTPTPIANPRTEPFRMVTPERSSFATPTSQICVRGQRLTSLPSPEIVCPFRSSVMPSAPITRPLLGQPVRSRSSVVSVVMVSPHLSPAGGDWPAAAVTPDRASRAINGNNLSVAIGVLSRSGIAGRSYGPCVAGETRLATVLAPCPHGSCAGVTVASPDADALGLWEDRAMRRTVLIVDDHEAFRESAAALLEAEGFDVVGAAADGDEAVAQAERLRPQVVLLDIQLPELDGFAVAERMAALPDPPRVVLISSRQARAYGPRLSAAPALGFITKQELSGEALAALVG